MCIGTRRSSVMLIGLFSLHARFDFLLREAVAVFFLPGGLVQ